jgi:hypothetical protein
MRTANLRRASFIAFSKQLAGSVGIQLVLRRFVAGPKAIAAAADVPIRLARESGVFHAVYFFSIGNRDTVRPCNRQPALSGQIQ